MRYPIAPVWVAAALFTVAACGGDETSNSPKSTGTSAGGSGSGASGGSSSGGTGGTGTTGGEGGAGNAGAVGGEGGGGQSSSGGGGQGGLAAGGMGGSGMGGSGMGGSGMGGGGMGGGGPVTTFDCSAAVGNVPALKLTPVAQGLNRPVLAISPPGDGSRLFILEQHDGEIRIVENGNLLATPFLDIGNIISTGNEEGLLGLAFHPDYAQNGRFFVHYSASGGGDTTIMEYERSVADPNVADPVPVQLVLQHFTQASNHNGGMIEFGPDGFLYIAIGDGGPQNDPECDAQLNANLLGKIVRLDVDAAPDAQGYPAAPGNPGGGKRYHVGFRNPWRMAFDPCTGDLYIGDVGQNAWEEVSVVSAADGPKNFGWPYREGAHNHGVPNPCPANPGGLVEPVAEYSHGDGCSVTGGFVYRGSNIPALRGTYFYGDYCTSLVRIFKWNGNQAMQMITDLSNDLNVPDSISSFGQDATGEVYVCAFNGTVYRIDQQ